MNIAADGIAIISPVQNSACWSVSPMSSWRKTGMKVIANVHSRKTKNIASPMVYSVRRQWGCSPSGSSGHSLGC